MIHIKNVERILDRLPRATPWDGEMPRLAPNAVICIDSVGRLNIYGEFGFLTIAEKDLSVLDSHPDLKGE